MVASAIAGSAWNGAPVPGGLSVGGALKRDFRTGRAISVTAVLSGTVKSITGCVTGIGTGIPPIG
jgi:hypothetical protein